MALFPQLPGIVNLCSNLSCHSTMAAMASSPVITSTQDWLSYTIHFNQQAQAKTEKASEILEETPRNSLSCHGTMAAAASSSVTTPTQGWLLYALHCAQQQHAQEKAETQAQTTKPAPAIKLAPVAKPAPAMTQETTTSTPTQDWLSNVIHCAQQRHALEKAKSKEQTIKLAPAIVEPAPRTHVPMHKDIKKKRFHPTMTICNKRDLCILQLAQNGFLSSYPAANQRRSQGLKDRNRRSILQHLQPMTNQLRRERLKNRNRITPNEIPPYEKQ